MTTAILLLGDLLAFAERERGRHKRFAGSQACCRLLMGSQDLRPGMGR